MFSKYLAKTVSLYNPLSKFFSTENTVIKSVPGNSPPSFEDSVQGKYAGVLFSSASLKESLHLVLEDMQYFS